MKFNFKNYTNAAKMNTVHYLTAFPTASNFGSVGVALVQGVFPGFTLEIDYWTPTAAPLGRE